MQRKLFKLALFLLLIPSIPFLIVMIGLYAYFYEADLKCPPDYCSIRSQYDHADAAVEERILSEEDKSCESKLLSPVSAILLERLYVDYSQEYVYKCTMAILTEKYLLANRECYNTDIPQQHYKVRWDSDEWARGGVITPVLNMYFQKNMMIAQVNNKKLPPCSKRISLLTSEQVFAFECYILGYSPYNFRGTLKKRRKYIPMKKLVIKPYSATSSSCSFISGGDNYFLCGYLEDTSYTCETAPNSSLYDFYGKGIAFLHGTYCYNGKPVLLFQNFHTYIGFLKKIVPDIQIESE